jgi:hypothetical protein
MDLPLCQIDIHLDQSDDGEPVWWADSPDIPGFSAGSNSLSGLRNRIWDALIKENLIHRDDENH